MAKNQLVYSMQAARWRAVQGRTPPVMTPYEKNLDAALSPETPPKPDELKAALLAVYAKFELFNGTVHQKAGLHLHLDGLLASLMTRTMPTQMIKTDRVTVEHSGSVDASGRQAAGPHHPAPARRGRPRLHRKLLWPVALPARTAAEGRAGALHRGASGLSPLVCLRRPQPGAGPYPRGKAPGRTGPASG